MRLGSFFSIFFNNTIRPKIVSGPKIVTTNKKLLIAGSKTANTGFIISKKLRSPQQSN